MESGAKGNTISLTFFDFRHHDCMNIIIIFFFVFSSSSKESFFVCRRTASVEWKRHRWNIYCFSHHHLIILPHIDLALPTSIHTQRDERENRREKQRSKKQKNKKIRINTSPTLCVFHLFRTTDRKCKKKKEGQWKPIYAPRNQGARIGSRKTNE